MQGMDQSSFVDMFKTSAVTGMRKLLACCERQATIFMMWHSSSDLMSLCNSEPALRESVVRVAKGLAETCTGMIKRSQNGEREPCECQCCCYVYLSQAGGRCKCTALKVPMADAKDAEACVPDAQVFFDMA